MKRIGVALIGVLIVMLCIMPALAEDQLVPDERSRIPEGAMDTQSPVLDGSAFTSYETFFVHGTFAEAEKDPDVVSDYDYGYGRYTMINQGGGAYIDCPIPSYEKKTGGVQPQVRYLAIYYKSDGTNPKIDIIQIWNGPNYVKTFDYSPAIYSGSWTVQIIDLGGWYTFNRGLMMAVHIANSDPTLDRTFHIAGYGARFEW
jgi:hypothetical protein